MSIQRIDKAKVLDMAYNTYKLDAKQEEAFWRALKGYASSVCQKKLELQFDDDVVQESMLEIWQAIDSFKGESSFSTWAYRIIFRNCQDRLRGMPKKTIDTSVSLESIAGTLTEDIAIKKEQLRMLDALVLKLDEGKREVVSLRREGLEFNEIAERLGISEDNVRQRLHRAIEEMRDGKG